MSDDLNFEELQTLLEKETNGAQSGPLWDRAHLQSISQSWYEKWNSSADLALAAVNALPYLLAQIAKLEAEKRLQSPGLPRQTDLAIELLTALDSVKHCGDYGQAWFNPQTGELHLSMGDSDGDEESGFTSFDEIRKLAGSVPGVKKVDIVAEWGRSGEAEWNDIGNFGERVAYPRRLPERGGW